MKTLSSDAHNLSSCAFSSRCVEWLDEIELIAVERKSAEEIGLAGQEARSASELAAHARGCVACTRALTRAGKSRVNQRRAFHLLLTEGEAAVPSMTESILAAIKSEAPARVPAPLTPPVPSFEALPITPVPIVLQEQARKRGRGNVQPLFVWLAAAVVILASIATFGQFVVRTVSTSLQSTAQRPIATVPSTTGGVSTPLVRTDTWSSVVLTRLSADGQRLIEQVDPKNGNRVQLVPNCCENNTVVDGVAHSGGDLLYHDVENGQTVYHLLSGKSFVLPGGTGNAVWSTKDERVFINDTKLVIQVAVNTGEEKKIALQYPITRLEFFYGEAIYASYEQDGVNNLYRIDLNTGAMDLIVKGAAPSYPFWIDLRNSADGNIDGSIFYVKYMDDGTPAIFRKDPTEQDGLLWRSNAIPIGYDRALTPIILQLQEDTIQVVQTGATDVDDKIIQDLVPTAKAICNESTQGSRPIFAKEKPLCYDSIAMHPEDGTSLVVGATYPDGSYRLSAVDLTQPDQEPRSLLELINQPEADVELVGWNKLQTPGP
jgi:hypothetical protein